MNRRTWLSLAFALALTGCGAKLDDFLYTRTRTDAYVFVGEDPDPSASVSEDRIELVPDGIPLPNGDVMGAVYIHANVEPPLGYCLFFHGKGGHIGEQFPHAKRIANMGFDVLAFDYRGWGTSTNVQPSQETLAADARAAWAYFVDRLGGDEAAFIYAHSLGTAISTELSTELPPRALVLEAPFASIQHFVQDNSQLQIPYEYIAKDPWPTVERIKSVNAPLLIFHGTLDDVKIEFGMEIFESSPMPPEKKRFVRVEGGGHSVAPTLGSEHGEITREFVVPFLGP